MLILMVAALLVQDPAVQRVDAVVRCLDIADDAQRLACFDANAAALRTGVQTGEVEVGEPARRRIRLPMDAHVAASSLTRNGEWRIELDNGLVWVTQARQRARLLPAVGAPVRIERGGLGTGYWLRIPGGGSYRLNRG